MSWYWIIYHLDMCPVFGYIALVMSLLLCLWSRYSLEVFWSFSSEWAFQFLFLFLAFFVVVVGINDINYFTNYNLFLYSENKISTSPYFVRSLESTRFSYIIKVSLFTKMTTPFSCLYILFVFCFVFLVFCINHWPTQLFFNNLDLLVQVSMFSILCYFLKAKFLLDISRIQVVLL